MGLPYKEGTALAREEYRNLAKAAPALIMNNGLMQTLAFYQDEQAAAPGTRPPSALLDHEARRRQQLQGQAS